MPPHETSLSKKKSNRSSSPQPDEFYSLLETVKHRFLAGDFDKSLTEPETLKDKAIKLVAEAKKNKRDEYRYVQSLAFAGEIYEYFGEWKVAVELLDEVGERYSIAVFT